MELPYWTLPPKAIAEQAGDSPALYAADEFEPAGGEQAPIELER